MKRAHRFFRPEGVSLTPEVYSAPLLGCLETDKSADDDMFNVMEVNTKESQKVRLWRVCRGQSTWHEEREVLGTWEESYGFQLQ